MLVHLVSKLRNGNYVVKRPAHQVNLSASPHVSLSSKLPKVLYCRQTHKPSACDGHLSMSPCGWLRWHHVKICQLFCHADTSPSDWNGPYRVHCLNVFHFRLLSRIKSELVDLHLCIGVAQTTCNLILFDLRQAFGCMCWCWVVQTDDTRVDISNISLNSGM